MPLRPGTGDLESVEARVDGVPLEKMRARVCGSDGSAEMKGAVSGKGLR